MISVVVVESSDFLQEFSENAIAKTAMTEITIVNF
jgi:hypothetical protein